MKKIVAGIVVLVIAAVASIPLWGSCDLKARYCTTVCDIKHYDNDMKATGCRASCSLNNIQCHGDDAVKELNDFMKGLKDN